MAEYTPVVNVAGRRQLLSAGDTLPASASAGWAYTTSPITLETGGKYYAVNSGSVTGDQYFNNVASLLSFDGNFTDAIGWTWTGSNGAVTSTTQKKFGTHSLSFPNNNSKLTATTTPTFDLVGDFTEEFWLYKASNPAGNIVFVERGITTPGYEIYMDTAGTVRFYCSAEIVATAACASNAWVHIAFARSGSTLRAYRDGTKDAEATFSTALTQQNDLVFGYGTQSPLNMYMDEYRRTTGVARYTGTTLTVPTAAFPRNGLQIDTPLNLTLPASIVAGNSFQIAVGTGPVQIIVGASRQIGNGGTNVDLLLGAGEVVRLVATSATQLELVL